MVKFFIIKVEDGYRIYTESDFGAIGTISRFATESNLEAMMQEISDTVRERYGKDVVFDRV
jgi:hypothetical protein